MEQLCDAGAISTLLSTFIEPLQSMADARGRLHTSININTETGRLSSRRPNLQVLFSIVGDKLLFFTVHC
jgi:DNA polymerase-1